MAKVTLSIVTLRRTRYSDRHCILTAWSREVGRVSLLVGDGAGRAATRLRALTAPPSLLECVADIRPGRDIHPASDFRQLAPLADVRANPLKGMSAMFLAEAMNALLAAAQPDEATYDFIDLALRILDTLSHPAAVANFHICFLYQLGRLLGVEPDAVTWQPGRMLDLRDGIFRTTVPLHPDFLTPDESRAAAMMGRMTFANMKKWKMTRDERNRSLDVILRYLSMHLAPSLRQLKSLEVLRTLL